MELIYRGVAYQYNPPYFKMMETKLAGKYRGANWKLPKLKEVLIPQSVCQLKYRGVTYCSERPQHQEHSGITNNGTSLHL